MYNRSEHPFYGASHGLRKVGVQWGFLFSGVLGAQVTRELYGSACLSWYFSSVLYMGNVLARLLDFCRLALDGITPRATANSRGSLRGLGVYRVRVHLRGDSVSRVLLVCDPRATLWFTFPGHPGSKCQQGTKAVHASIPSGSIPLGQRRGVLATSEVSYCVSESGASCPGECVRAVR